MTSFRLLLRFLTVGALVLLLLVPLAMIRGLVQDRQAHRAAAVQRVAEGMAGPQRLTGPLRVVPWTATRQVNAAGADGRLELREETVSGYLVQAPATLHAGGVLLPEARRVGLYDVRVFRWQAELEATFEPLALPRVDGRRYGTPYLAFGLGDVRGLVGTPGLEVDGAAARLSAGTADLGGRLDGVHARLVPPAADASRLEASRARLRMDLAGTRSLAIVPVADSNEVRLRSAWPHPSFGGRFLPSQREVGAEGFSASWSVSSLASAARAQVLAAVADPATGQAASRPGAPADWDSLEVALVDPVDAHTRVDRATKYGVLFVVLTFVGFALLELVRGLRIHPLQYLMVGLALAVFFLLLLALSEHVAFGLAYLASAAACIGLQFAYVSGVLRSWWRAGVFAGLLSGLYGMLYSLLAAEDHALLMGSLLLFGVLALVMLVTRRIDWYERSASLG
ncbi:cell envelope integrity protein CreD [Pseudoxanthomonas sp. SGNA-20]|uniref:cell envelope integrity protein CreD n=1 Tax=Pseudoxanthomonas sp. SGNA-20 TaxID=2493088 RepID=UPI000F64074C|nr:cell envelope integrity protein CreD [Pseudoxanthomonas sp. SGNA-20]RRN57369.1 cell envelope integrity protein CreD [Pseudoxanthomonas sp. SGNA-20]